MLKINKIDKYSELNYLILWLSSLFLLSLFLLTWMPSYFGLTPSSDIVLAGVSDGWCDSKTQGIGLHCFGDYYYPLNFTESSNPWDIEAAPPYSAASFIIFSAFNELSIVFNNASLGLYMFLLSSPLLMILILTQSYRKFKYPFLYVVVMFAFVIASWPFLFAFDRGNSILLALPLTILLLRNFINKNYTMFFVALVLMSFIKIQFILFLLILLTTREIFKFLTYGLSIIVLNIVPFIFFEQNIAYNLNAYFRTFVNFQDYAYAPAGTLNFNLSLPNSIAILDRFVFNNPASDISYPPTLISVLGLILVCLFLWIRGNKLDPMHSFLIIILFIILAPNVSFAYYLILFLGYLTYAVLDYIESISKGQNEQIEFKFLNQLTKQNRIFILASYILLFIPWSIPWIAVIPNFASLNLGEFNASITRFPGQLVLVLLFFSLLFTRSTKILNKTSLRR
jgi:hypothetical protein